MILYPSSQSLTLSSKPPGFPVFLVTSHLQPYCSMVARFISFVKRTLHADDVLCRDAGIKSTTTANPGWAELWRQSDLKACGTFDSSLEPVVSKSSLPSPKDMLQLLLQIPLYSRPHSQKTFPSQKSDIFDMKSGRLSEDSLSPPWRKDGSHRRPDRTGPDFRSPPWLPRLDAPL